MFRRLPMQHRRACADMETEQMVAAQLKKSQQQVEWANVEAAAVAAEVQQLQKSMLALTTTVSDLLASTG